MYVTYSRASIGHSSPKLNYSPPLAAAPDTLASFVGVLASQVVHAQHVFVTHGHLDHCGAICSHARLRALRGNLPGKYYMHAELAEGMAKVSSRGTELGAHRNKRASQTGPEL